MAGQKDLPQGRVVRDKGDPELARRVLPARVRLSAINALEPRGGKLVVPHEIAIRGDQALEILLREDQSLLVRHHDAFGINLVVTTVWMNPDPVSRRAITFVVLGPSRLPVVPDEVFAIFTGFQA